jgi:hypothetical protein
MTDAKEKSVTVAPEPAPSTTEIYGMLATLALHSETVRWTRVNTLLVVDSILLAAWAGLFAGTNAFLGKETLLALLCVPGVILGVLFAWLGWRSSEYMDDFHYAAHEMEKQFPPALPRPFHISESRRETVRKSLVRFTSSKLMVAAIPLVFAVLFLGLAGASFFVAP